MLRKPLVRIALMLIIGIVICAAIVLPRNERVKQYMAEREVNQLLADYTDNTVLKTYDLVVDNFKKLDKAVNRLQENPSERTISEATAIWFTTRNRWKTTMAFLYGPVAFYDFDKQVAGWPLDRPMIEHTIAEIAAGRLQVDDRYLRELKHVSQRGLHAVEYLLFRDGKARSVSEISKAELSYLVAVTRAMVIEGLDMKASWVGTENMNAADSALLKAAGLKSRTAYAVELKNPGKPESRYLTQSIPLQEITQDTMTVMEEVCSAIDEALGSSDPRDSQTWFSYNVVDDIVHELKSAENTYMGGIEGSRGTSFSDLVAKKSDMLDQRVKLGFADLEHRIKVLGSPYNSDMNASERDLAYRIAMQSCHALSTRLLVAMPMIALDPRTKPLGAYGIE